MVLGVEFAERGYLEGVVGAGVGEAAPWARGAASAS